MEKPILDARLAEYVVDLGLRFVDELNWIYEIIRTNRTGWFFLFLGLVGILVSGLLLFVTTLAPRTALVKTALVRRRAMLR